MIKKIAVSLVLGVAFASAGNAADLLITPVPSGSGTQLSFEFVNDSNASAVEFEVELKGISEENLDMSGCSGGVSTHSGACSFRNGVLTFIMFSPSNAALPTAQIGHVTLDVAASRINALEASKLVIADTQGQSIDGGNILVDPSRIAPDQRGNFKAK